MRITKKRLELEDHKINCETLIKAETLPAENEIIITEDGLVLIDENGKASELEIDAEQIGETIWCG